MRLWLIAALLLAAVAGGATPFTATGALVRDAGGTTTASQGIAVVSDRGAVRSIGVQSFAARPTSAPVVDIAVTPSGRGYMTLNAKGGLAAYGDAPRLRRARSARADDHAVALALTPDGRGAFVAYASGSIGAVGTARPLKRVAPKHRVGRRPAAIVDVALAPSGTGLWVVSRNGLVDAFGSATVLPDAPASSSRVAGIAGTPTGEGAWVVRENGSVLALGDAKGARTTRGPRSKRATGIASLGTLDMWVVAYVDGWIERSGTRPAPLTGKGSVVVAIDATASSAAVVAGSAGAPWTTKVVAPGAVLGTSGKLAGTLVVRLPGFVTGGALPLVTGDVFAVGIGPKTPNGLLRKITALKVLPDGTVEATTEPATLADALPAGKLSFSDDLADLDVGEMKPRTSGKGFVKALSTGPATLSRGAPRPLRVAAASGALADPGRFQYGCPSDPSERDPSLTVKPNFSLDPELLWEFEWDGDAVHVKAGVALQGEIGAEVTANTGLTCDATFKLVDSHKLGNYVIFIGTVPIVVQPSVSLEAKLEGKLKGSLVAKLSGTFNVSTALVVDLPAAPNSTGVRVDGSRSANGHFDLEASLGAEVSFSLTPSLAFLIYGVAAPTIELEIGLTAEFEPCETPNMKLELPAKLTTKIEPSEWFGKMLRPLRIFDVDVSTEFEAPGSPYLLASKHVPQQGSCGDEATELPVATEFVPYTTALAVELPDGAHSPSFTLAPGDTLPPGLTISSDGVLSGTPTQPGHFAFGVVVSHSLGSSSAAFELTVVSDQLAVVTTSLPIGKVGNTYSTTLSGSRPAADLVWSLASGTLPDGLSLTTDGRITGTPTSAGVSGFTVHVAHPASGQSADAVLALTVQADVGAVGIGLSYRGQAVADVNPDGGIAAILYDTPANGAQGWRLVGITPEGTRAYEAHLPGCKLLVNNCEFFPFAFSSVARTPDGGAVVLLLENDGPARVARFGPTGATIWEKTLTSIPANARAEGITLAPNGSIAVATGDGPSPIDALECDSIDRTAALYGSNLVELTADGEITRDLRLLPSPTCLDLQLGLDEATRIVTGIVTDSEGDFVAVGSHLRRGPEGFRVDAGTVTKINGVSEIWGAAASGEGLYVSIAAGSPCGTLVGLLNATTVTPFPASPLCAVNVGRAGLTGTAGVPGSLVGWYSDLRPGGCPVFEGSRIERISDTGTSLVRRTVPDGRVVRAAVAGSGGQVYTVETEIPTDCTPNDGLLPLFRRALNPDLTDSAP